jgi:hypothetical protein
MTCEELLESLNDRNGQSLAEKRFRDLRPRLVGETFHHEYIMFDLLLGHLGSDLRVLEIGAHCGFSTCFTLSNPNVREIVVVDEG